MRQVFNTKAYQDTEWNQSNLTISDIHVTIKAVHWQHPRAAAIDAPSLKLLMLELEKFWLLSGQIPAVHNITKNTKFPYQERYKRW